MKKHLSIFLLVILLCINAISQQCSITPPARVPIGANLLSLTDYSRDRAFNDVFKTSRPMSANIQQPYNFTPLPLDINGWPLNDFGVVVMDRMDSTTGGVYKIKFNGQAVISRVSGSNFTIANQLYDSLTNTTTADLIFPKRAPYSVNMMIGFTSTKYDSKTRGIKNIKIMKPDIAFTGATFSRKFLEHLKKI